jgi:hypothetical protein
MVNSSGKSWRKQTVHRAYHKHFPAGCQTLDFKRYSKMFKLSSFRLDFRMQCSSPITFAHHRFARQFYRGLPSKELEQYRDPSRAGHDSRDHRPQIMKRAARDNYLLPGNQFLVDYMDLFRSDRGAQFFQVLVRNRWPLGTEMNHPANAPRMMDFPKAAAQLEPREKIVREQRLRKPNRSLLRRASKPYPRQVHLNARLGFQVRRGNVLMLGLRANTKPSRFRK